MILSPSKTSKLYQLYMAMMAVDKNGWAIQFIQAVLNNEPIDEPFRMRALDEALFSNKWKKLTQEQQEYLKYVISNYPDLVKIAEQKAKQEGYNMPDGWNILNYYADRPYTYMHFTATPELIGINPKTEYSTPAGIYGYPLTKQFLAKLKKEDFAANRQYIVIYSASNPKTMLNLANYSEKDFVEDVKKLFDNYGKLNLFADSWPPAPAQTVDDVLFISSKEAFKPSEPGSKLFYVLYKLSNGNAAAFNKALRLLGYSGADDPGKGIIHRNEPAQGFVMGSGDAVILDIIKNPLINSTKKNVLPKDLPLNSPYKSNIESIRDVGSDTASQYIAITKLPAKDLLAFADTDDPILLRILAWKMALDDLHHIMNAKDSETRAILASRIDSDDQVYTIIKNGQMTKTILINLLSNKRLSVELIDKLISIFMSSNWGISAQEIIRDPRLPTSVFNKLLLDKKIDEKSFKQILENGNIHENTLKINVKNNLSISGILPYSIEKYLINNCVNKFTLSTIAGYSTYKDNLILLANKYDYLDNHMLNNNNTPSEAINIIVDRAIQNNHVNLIEKAACLKNTDVKTLLKIINYLKPKLSYSNIISSAYSLPSEILEQMFDNYIADITSNNYLIFLKALLGHRNITEELTYKIINILKQCDKEHLDFYKIKSALVFSKYCPKEIIIEEYKKYKESKLYEKIKNIYFNENTPDVVINDIINSKEINFNVVLMKPGLALQHVFKAFDSLDYKLNYINRYIGVNVEEGTGVPHDFYDILYEKLADRNDDLEGLLYINGVPGYILEKLYNYYDNNDDHRINDFAKHKNCPPKILDNLADRLIESYRVYTDDSMYFSTIFYDIVNNKNTSSDTLSKLYNPSCPLRSHALHFAAAKNINPEILDDIFDVLPVNEDNYTVIVNNENVSLKTVLKAYKKINTISNPDFLNALLEKDLPEDIQYNLYKKHKNNICLPKSKMSYNTAAKLINEMHNNLMFTDDEYRASMTKNFKLNLIAQTLNVDILNALKNDINVYVRDAAIEKLKELLTKQASSNIETITIDKSDPRLIEYKDQIFEIIKKRYADQLGMFKWMLALKFMPPEFIQKLKFDKITLTIDKNTNTVLAVSGINERDFMSRVRMFAMPEGLNAKSSLEAIKQQIDNLFKNKSYAELTVDLFDRLYKIVKLIKKMNPDFNQQIYIYPAYTAALVMPHRKMLVNENGISYEKKVHRADTVGHKVFISNVPEIYGVKGSENFDDLIPNTKYNGKLISSNGYDIKIHDFNSELWGK